MDSLYFLIPITLVIVSVAIVLFIWAVKSGQMDDLERPGHSILYEDDEAMIPESARPKEHPPEADAPGPDPQDNKPRHD